jgi:hypothetical protein
MLELHTEHLQSYFSRSSQCFDSYQPVGLFGYQNKFLLHTAFIENKGFGFIPKPVSFIVLPQYPDRKVEGCSNPCIFRVV